VEKEGVSPIVLSEFFGRAICVNVLGFSSRFIRFSFCRK
jgi:hypothetical protein